MFFGNYSVLISTMSINHICRLILKTAPPIFARSGFHRILQTCVRFVCAVADCSRRFKWRSQLLAYQLKLQDEADCCVRQLCASGSSDAQRRVRERVCASGPLGSASSQFAEQLAAYYSSTINPGAIAPQILQTLVPTPFEHRTFNWSKYQQRLKQYFAAQSIDDDRRRHATLMSLIVHITYTKLRKCVSRPQ